MEGFGLEGLQTIKSHRLCTQHVAEFDRAANAAGGTGGDKELGLGLGDDLRPQLSDRHLWTVLAKVELRFHAYDALAGNAGEEVATQALALERRGALADDRHKLGREVMRVVIPRSLAWVA